MNLSKLSQTELAELFLVEPRSIRNYMNEKPPLPSYGKGRNLHFVWDEALDWRDRRKHKSLLEAVKAKDPEAPIESVERAFLTRALRERKDLENAKLRKEVLSLEDFEKALSDMITPARVNLLGIEPRLRAKIGAAAAALVGAEVRLVLKDLGGDAAPAKAG